MHTVIQLHILQVAGKFDQLSDYQRLGKNSANLSSDQYVCVQTYTHSLFGVFYWYTIPSFVLKIEMHFLS
jgi:hypothetical protein